MDFPITLGIIMDGNRRWAKEKDVPIKEGHVAGAKKLQEVLGWIKDTKIENVICYAFSTENWKREEGEVANLMELLEKVLGDTELIESGYKITIIGEKEKFSMSLQTTISLVEQATNTYTKNLFIALSYGGRAEITRVCNALIEKKKSVVSEQDIQNELYTKDIPDPDLIIRTGGRHSLSNFLIWQAAYAEFSVTDTLWPALTKEELFTLFEGFSEATRKMGA